MRPRAMHGFNMNAFFARFSRSLRAKVLLATAAVVFSMGIVFVFLAQRTGSAMLEQQARLRGTEVSEFMDVILGHAMLEGQRDHVRHALEEITAVNHVRGAFITRSDLTLSGTLGNEQSAALWNADLAKQFARDSPAPQMLTRREQDSLVQYVIVPIKKKQECYRCHRAPDSLQGFFVVKVSIDDLRAMASEHRMFNVGMTTATFGGLVVILYFTLSALVIRPVSRLHRHLHDLQPLLEQLRTGKDVVFPVMEAPRGNDEIAHLFSDFNQLVKRLNEAYAELNNLHHRQLEQADRVSLAGQMAASVAHEIKNPITGVQGALQVFESEMAPDHPHKEILGEMRIQLGRVDHAVNDLLAFARPTPPVREPLLIDVLIAKTVTMLRPLVRNSSITLLNESATPGVNVHADRKLVQQVLWNIMLNGIQSMEGSGMLIVSTALKNGEVRVTVSDTGKGIPGEQLAKIFEPFYTTKHRGTGLGMTICKRVIEQHGGAIQVRSEPGKGTTVSVTLPTYTKESLHAG